MFVIFFVSHGAENFGVPENCCDIEEESITKTLDNRCLEDLFDFSGKVYEVSQKVMFWCSQNVVFP